MSYLNLTQCPQNWGKTSPPRRPPKLRRKTLRQLKKIIERRKRNRATKGRLDTWIRLRPAISSAIVWNAPDGTELIYLHWPAALKAELVQAYDQLVDSVNNGTPYTGLAEAPTLSVVPGPSDFPVTRLSPDPRVSA